MPKGGARTRSGPAPDPNALRRDRPADAAEWVVLPAAGRTGPPPDWPLTEPADRELGIWATLWAKPQAIVWEQQGQQLEVALYVRRLCEAEESGAPAVLTTLVRQLGDSLGISTPGMRANRWRIGETVEAQPAPRKAAAPRSARDRLRVVGDGA